MLILVALHGYASEGAVAQCSVAAVGIFVRERSGLVVELAHAGDVMVGAVQVVTGGLGFGLEGSYGSVVLLVGLEQAVEPFVTLIA